MNNFDLKSTSACKGVALMLLLWCHLFYLHPEFGIVVYKTALHAKVCVAIFVILSGYGFSESVRLNKYTGIFQFYKNRLIFIYSNYWFNAFVFIFIGFFMGKTLESSFTSNAYTKFVVQMTGFHRFVYDEYGYNMTWWYMSVIVPLILAFPFIYDAVRKFGFFTLLCFFSLLIFDKPVVSVLNVWLLPFALGIYLSQGNYISKISKWLGMFGGWRFMLLAVAIISILVFRNYSPFLSETKIDWLFGLLIILITFELCTTIKFFNKPLHFLGKNLFNIFLFHTFIYYYFWGEFIYSFNSSILIFIIFLFLCIAVSEVLEHTKKLIGFYFVTRKLQGLNVPFSMEIPFQQNAPKDVHSSR